MHGERLPIFKLVLKELQTRRPCERVLEPVSIEVSKANALAYRAAGRPGGAFAGTHYFLLRELAARIPHNAQVIDLGCGTADLLFLIAELRPDSHFTGVDLSSPMLEVANEEMQKRGIKNISFIQDDMSKLDSVKDRSFDFVMSTVALHHLPTSQMLKTCFETIQRILKTTGELFIFDFVRVRNEENMRVIMEVTTNTESPAFQIDLLNSMKAAFSKREFDDLCRDFSELGIKCRHTFVPFAAIIYGSHRKQIPTDVGSKLEQLYKSLPQGQKYNIGLLRLFLGPRFF